MPRMREEARQGRLLYKTGCVCIRSSEGRPAVVSSEKEYIQNGENPCKIRISAVFLYPFVAYLSLNIL